MKLLSESEGLSVAEDHVAHPVSEGVKQWLRGALAVLMTLVLTAIGGYAASGAHLEFFSSSGGKQMPGIAYGATFSDVLYRSGKTYNSYMWEMDDRYRIEMSLPDLSGESKPEELRGIAKITWDIDKDVQDGSRTYKERTISEHKVLYRLVRESAGNGSIYYSSVRGAAAILPGGEKPRRPLSVE